MPARCDASAVHSLTARAEAEMRELSRDMNNAVKLAAQYERNTHAYRNRTYRLQRSTKGLADGRGRAVLIMGMPYAVYIRARGLTNINEAMVLADRRIRQAFEMRRRNIAG